MEVVAEKYINGVKSKLINYFAAWLPNEPLALGDVGVVEDNLFIRVTTLKELGIPFKIRKDPHPSPIDIVSSSEVSIELKAAGETNDSLPSIPKAKAGVGIEFGAKGAFIVKAEKSYTPSIENIDKVQKAILQLLSKGKWERKWSVITKTVEAPKASIIISNSSSSKISIQADADVSLSDLDLGSANLSFTVTSQKGDMIKIIGAENVTPFFQLSGVKWTFLHGDIVKPMALRKPSPLSEGSSSAETSVSQKPIRLPYFDLITYDDNFGNQ